MHIQTDRYTCPLIKGDILDDQKPTTERKKERREENKYEFELRNNLAFIVKYHASLNNRRFARCGRTEQDHLEVVFAHSLDV